VNRPIFRLLNGMAGHSAALDSVIRFFASDAVFVLFAVLTLLVFRRLRARELRPVAWVGSALVLAYLLGLVAAQLVSERRPFTDLHDVHLLIQHKPGQSFPSDHATASFAIALAVLVWLSRRWGLALLGLAAVIALARVAAGVHYPGDVLGSLVVALIAVGGVAVVERSRSRDAAILHA
jgi:undecaprenyl-diphosphatase